MFYFILFIVFFVCVHENAHCNKQSRRSVSEQQINRWWDLLLWRKARPSPRLAQPQSVAMLEQTAKSRYSCWLWRSSDPASDSSIRPRGAAPANSAAIKYHGKARRTQRHLNRRLSSKRQGREASRWGVNGDRVYLKSVCFAFYNT